MLKNFFPNKILNLKNKTINNLFFFLILIFFIGIIYSLILSPPDFVQGDSVRIMYVHVPSSFLALGCFALMGMASIFNVVFKIKFMPLFAKSLAPIGCVFSLISIVTGSFWGKPTWGTWWVWDARLTSMVILFLFYVAYILSWKFIANFEKANKISSLIAILCEWNLSRLSPKLSSNGNGVLFIAFSSFFFPATSIPIEIVSFSSRGPPISTTDK